MYFLITCIGTEKEKVRQDVTDYELEFKISVCMPVNFEFRILTWNYEFLLNFKFRFQIINFYFKFRILILNFETQGSMSTGGVVSV